MEEDMLNEESFMEGLDEMRKMVSSFMLRQSNLYDDLFAKYPDHSAEEIAGYFAGCFVETYMHLNGICFYDVDMEGIDYAFDSGQDDMFALRLISFCLKMFIPVTLTSVDFKKSFSRKLLIPATFDLASAMAVMISSLRTGVYHQAMLSDNAGMNFMINPDSDLDVEDAFSFGSLILCDIEKATLVYDFGEEWKFKVTIGSPKKYTKYEPMAPAVIKAEGYGIFEDNKWILEKFIENNDSEIEGTPVREIMDFDFNDSRLDELNEFVKKDYEDVLTAYTREYSEKEEYIS